MRVHIEHIDTRNAAEALLTELAGLYDALDAEDLPGDPPTPNRKRIVDWRMAFARFPIRRWILRVDGSIVGAAVARYDIEENLQNGTGRIAVHPDHRGKGHARRLATPLFDHLEENGRTRLDTWITKGAPAEDLAGRLGLEPVLSERRSRLLVDEVDFDLMKSWIDRATDRATDYDLIVMNAPFPEQALGNFCTMMEIMNTAPLEDYEMEEEHITPEDWRDIEASVLEGQNQIHNLTAVHRRTGEFVGYTQLKTQDLQPDLAWQWDTGVHPDHRNKGIGRWLKAAMVMKIATEHPEVKRIDTENAGSNQPMLSINHAMGFKPIHESGVWQGDLATARTRFGV